MPFATSPQRLDSPLLILDFDGTVCIGDGPVWAYANAVLTRISDADRAQTVRARLAEFLSGTSDAPRYADGYAAVAELTAGAVDPDSRQAAYRESRTALATGLASGVAAPDGLHEFLTGIGMSADRVLVTNAPPDGVKETLSVLGLTDVIDEIHPNANKPAGFVELLAGLAAGRDPAMMMSVGDLYDNDIAPPYAFGCATAYIDRWDHRTGPAHLHAASLPPLYSAIADWAANPVDFRTTHAPTHAPIHSLD